jgi:hypothetical protein
MYTRIHILAPEGTQWPLGVDAFEGRLRQGLPGAILTPRTQTSSGAVGVPFKIDDDDDELHEGLYIEGEQLILFGGTPEIWSNTIAWFLGLLPAGSPSLAMVEVNPEAIAPIPHGVGAADIEALLNRMTSEVE